VRQIDVPPKARALSTLSRIDYEDAFLVNVDGPHERTAEQWARAILERAPVIVQQALRWSWSLLGLKLRGQEPGRFLLGWEVRSADPDFVLLGADSLMGMPAELLLTRRQRALLFDTFVQLPRPFGHAIWAVVEPVHRPIVRNLLEQGISRIDEHEPDR
jgi:hypothetical protein